MHIHALHIISSIITKASSGITRKANVASHKIILRHKSEQNGKLSGSSLFKQMRPRSYFQPVLCHSLSRISITAARNYPRHYQLLLAPLPSSHRPAGCNRRSGRQSRSGGTPGCGTWPGPFSNRYSLVFMNKVETF